MRRQRGIAEGERPEMHVGAHQRRPRERRDAVSAQLQIIKPVAEQVEQNEESPHEQKNAFRPARDQSIQLAGQELYDGGELCDMPVVDEDPVAAQKAQRHGEIPMLVRKTDAGIHRIKQITDQQNADGDGGDINARYSFFPGSAIHIILQYKKIQYNYILSCGRCQL